ncbi:MAG: hypothetical protein JWN44_825 [Myxococcales bacterium]|nr:hypothetical protein [Myxococcales bacterium]
MTRFLLLTGLSTLAAACSPHGASGLALDGGLPAGGGAIVDNGDGSYTIPMTFTVAPGEERYECRDFANPFGGAEAAIARFESHLSPGAHHLLLFYKPGARDGAPERCSGTELAAGPYGSQRSDDALAYPSGVGAVVPSTSGFRVQAHYLNASTAPLTATVQLRMIVAPPASVRDHAAVLFFTNTNLDIPAGATGAVATKSCTLPFDVNLIQATGHMHRHGVAFFASASASPSETLFDSHAWQDVAPALFEPPVHLAAGTSITFSCTYDNPGPTALGYGDSAQSNEMCIFTAQFYPAPFGGWSCS